MQPLTDNAHRVLEARYLRRDSHGDLVETPGELFRRVAAAVAAAEDTWGAPGGRARWEPCFEAMMSGLEFLPNSPTLMNAGTACGQLSACFVLPVHDRLEDIFEAVKQMALIQRTGGGTGFSFSRIRPHADLLASSGGRAAGPVAFMKVFDCATEHVKQGGRRRGANMGVLRVDHPDILEFIDAKLDGHSLRNFNLSVAMPDAFMQALAEDREYPLVHPGTGQVVGQLPARALMERLGEAAWRTGDPGVLFLDAINRANPTPDAEAIEATNPCGEVPLLPYEACTLGSINLNRMIRRRQDVTEVDWDRLDRTVIHAVRFLDDVVEINRYPFEAVAQASRSNRKIGLGVMGFADLLIELGLPYGSEASLGLAASLMRRINDTATQASMELARERGVFPNWSRSRAARRDMRLRNATRTAIAPTGSLSLIAGASAGIEPLFALAYRRVGILDHQTLTECHPLLQRWMEAEGLDVATLMPKVWASGTLQGLAEVPEPVRRLFVTAHELPPSSHLAMQAAFQPHVDNSVSKTVNLPAHATPAGMIELYRRAWELGLKGVTLYRYGSKASQVLELGTGKPVMTPASGNRCDPEACRV